MGILVHNTNINKNIELSNLETHVAICSQRYKALEDRIDRLEHKVDDIVDQLKSINRIIIGAIVTVITSTTATVIAVLIQNFHRV